MVDVNEARAIARLARIGMSDAETEAYAGQLDQILTYVQRLREVDVTGVEPMRHATELRDVLREDEPRESLDRGLVLGFAPDHDTETVRVPKTVDR